MPVVKPRTLWPPLGDSRRSAERPARRAGAFFVLNGNLGLKPIAALQYDLGRGEALGDWPLLLWWNHMLNVQACDFVVSDDDSTRKATADLLMEQFGKQDAAGIASDLAKRKQGVPLMTWVAIRQLIDET
jgi:hypothetical protein